MRRRRWIAACFAVPAALLVLAAAAQARTRVGLGDYQASVVKVDSYTLGAFTVVKDKQRRKIVPTDSNRGIFYPDANECDRFDLPLAAQRIPIKANGRFVIRERTPAQNSFVRVVWKGHWSQPGVVSGSISIAYGDCTSRHRWTGGKVAKAG